jgi:DNA helicase II / ATP-dependent DNA helicase PcrA
VGKTNKLIIAAAGAGKTTYLINEALLQEGNVLITTYTEANEREIRKKFFEINGFIPKNITIQTWFSMLIQHGVKPYQNYLFDEKINGMILVNQQSAPYKPASNIREHYLTKDNKIFSDKLSKFVFICEEKSSGAIFDRLNRIYSHIFIDEVQDLAGYDLELIKILFQTKSNIVLVGDPRQVTYLTHNENKHKKYSDGRIKDFVQIECRTIPCTIDESTLNCTYRNNEIICSFALKLYPEFNPCTSKQVEDSYHKGIYFIRKADLNKYLQIYKPIQLRYSKKTKIDNTYSVMNFGESKGLGFDRVLIYPTKPILDWILKGTSMEPTSRSKFYVAITRAKHSVGIVYDYADNLNIDSIQKWTNN